LLNSDRFRYAKGVVGRFLVMLSWLHERHRDQFAVVVNIKGRGRLYFAKSPEPLHENGRSVNPKQIPGTDWWVITTSPTILKQEMLSKVMEAFKYTRPEIVRAQSAIAA